MFDLGDPVPLSVEIRDENGTFADAGNVTLIIGRPDGTNFVIDTMPSVSPGRYEYDYQPTLPGRHTVRWVSTGLNAAAYTDTFDVRPATPPYIISLADARAHLGLTGTSDDEELREFVEAATMAIEDIRGEAVARQTVVEEAIFRRPTWSVHLGKAPVITLTSVQTANGLVVWDPINMSVDADGILTVHYGPSLYGRVVFTYVAGYPMIPANFTLAAKIIVRHLWQTQQQPSLGPRPFQGEDDGGMIQTSYGFAIPNRAAQLLGGGRGVFVA